MSILDQLKKLNKKRVLTTVWSLVAVSWIALFGVLFVVEEKSIQVAAATITALFTEGAIWSTAAVTGVAVVESRKAVISAIKRKLTGYKSA
ncbi:hypothetical protein N474_18565 [Pseudoalteromonas luteoviolacea CPMOR-2]|uniref:Holin n=1 Tax=Pseudoalteromonas luteoviolacea DSM 6061 TaxID=1365250 RepID=A0A166VWF5_9GAMM|nr:hypothetical protein [Pseudoalteromonas luteoviolacea]KZN33948.1 hypothetical protein N475_19580 [Pseudoalteromonas luteoviolacea DSM 6061]KZN54002.1 hypothetical protein N474_18565 [Pseudoalteromonas luteoviolacea CPMOR-2]MBE0385822.1 hypothetical protein [Pseudoalteromonas luteoviolacea DSM 6061]